MESIDWVAGNLQRASRYVMQRVKLTLPEVGLHSQASKEIEVEQTGGHK